MLLGLVLRLAAATLLTPHVDEAASILAAHAVVERGLPIFPSGTVYTQGAVLSYLLAPLVRLGFDGLGAIDLTVLRSVSVVAGAASVFLAARLGQLATGKPWVGAVAAGLVALDPIGVQWSGHVRMYGLLQAISLGLALLYLRALAGAPGRTVPAGLVLLFGVGVFTHVGTLLLWPGMALVAVWAHGRALLGARRGLALALVACPLWVVGLVGLNRALGSASVGASAAPASSTAATGRALSFVGDNLLAPLALLRDRLSIAPLGGLVSDHTLVWLIPGLIVAGGGLLAWHHWLRPGADGDPAYRRPVAALLALYWGPVLAVGLFTVSPKERYLLHAHLLGYVLVAAVVVELLGRRPIPTGGRRGLLAAVAVGGLAPAIVLGLVAGVAWRFAHPVVHPDYPTALAFVEERREAGEPVLVALPAIAHLGLGDDAGVRFLAVPEDRPRAQRYTRRTADGRLIDYWIGAPSITSPAQLCEVFHRQPGAWVVVDEVRLDAPWGYQGVMADAVRATTRPVFAGPGEVLVLRPKPRACGNEPQR